MCVVYRKWDKAERKVLYDAGDGGSDISCRVWKKRWI